MKDRNLRRLSTSFRLSMSLVTVGLFASLALSLSFFHQPGLEATYFDHLLTAISLVSVTGMAALPIGESYNFLGQLVCLALIQVGGLGVITIINLTLYYLNRRISLQDQLLMQNALNRDSNANFFDFLLSIYRFTLLAELVGAGILMIDFVPRYGWGAGAFNAFFLSVSAFNNSGFHNLGHGSLEAFSQSPLVLLTVAGLVIVGGIGFVVWFELKDRLARLFSDRPFHVRQAFHNLSVHTRVVLKMTLALIVLGTLLIYLVEIRNPQSMVPLAPQEQFLNAFFLSVSSRTAGFTSIQYEFLQPFTKFLLMVLTTIGGAPGGTAGGIKVTTFAILLLLFRSEIRSYSEVVVERRIISSGLVKRAVLIVIFFMALLIFGYSIMLIIHPHLPALDLLFEVVNALGTTGVSLNLTSQLYPSAKLLLIVLMVAGRVGPITLLLGVLQRKDVDIHYAYTNVYLG